MSKLKEFWIIKTYIQLRMWKTLLKISKILQVRKLKGLKDLKRFCRIISIKIKIKDLI